MRIIDAYRAIDMIDEWLDSVGTVLVGKPLSGYEELIECIENTPTFTPPNEWVRVEERLPEEKQRVIVRCERVGTSVGWILWGRWMTDIGPDAGKVTHWRPLPAPPDKDNNVPAKTPNEPLTLTESAKNEHRAN